MTDRPKTEQPHGRKPRNTDGLRRGGGRPKGSPNKATRAFKEAVEAVYGRLGGDDGLFAWAQSNQDEFYKSVWTKLAPKNIDVTTDGKPVGGIVYLPQKDPSP